MTSKLNRPLRGRPQVSFRALVLERNASHDDTEGRRIGEAKNPGPSRRGVAAPWLHETRTRINAGGPPKGKAPRPDEFELSVETVNGTCWRSLQSYVENSQAHVLCLQEYRIADPRKLAAASRWCANNGWKSVCLPALPSSDGGEASGGTAILASASHLGLAEAEDHLERSHRVVGAQA